MVRENEIRTAVDLPARDAAPGTPGWSDLSHSIHGYWHWMRRLPAIDIGADRDHKTWHSRAPKG
jgi:hypothetical protein